MSKVLLTPELIWDNKVIGFIFCRSTGIWEEEKLWQKSRVLSNRKS
jgi:hypothetical protein